MNPYNPGGNFRWLNYKDLSADMARRATPQSPPLPARLLIPVNEARERLVSRREQGSSLLETQRASVTSAQSFEDAKTSYKKWNEFNRELLRRIFDTEEYSIAYANAGIYGGSVYSLGMGSSISDDVREHFERLSAKINYLDGLAERLELIDVVPSAVSNPEPAANPTAARPHLERSKKKVFVVHGQDSETKNVVARFIERCGLEPVILHEQADQGRTIIEKFEQVSDVSFAVVLLTPDDLGGVRPTSGGHLLENAQARARQNVILELGYFMGKLGRDGVCALKKGDMELPSDFSGVVYTPYDGADEGWKIKLAREMRAAGLEVDLNKALA